MTNIGIWWLVWLGGILALAFALKRWSAGMIWLTLLGTFVAAESGMLLARYFGLLA